MMDRLWRNWPAHNLVAHPLSEIVYWLTFWWAGDGLSHWIHDITIPEHEEGNGRG